MYIENDIHMTSSGLFSHYLWHMIINQFLKENIIIIIIEVFKTILRAKVYSENNMLLDGLRHVDVHFDNINIWHMFVGYFWRRIRIS